MTPDVTGGGRRGRLRAFIEHRRVQGGIIVNAMQSYTEKEQRETVVAVEQAREHIEADLHAEVRAMRVEIRELKTLLTLESPARSHATPDHARTDQ